MLIKNICGLFLILTFCFSAAMAQKVAMPEEKTAERQMILNALSVPVSKELKQKVSFSTEEKFEVQGNWAFVAGQVRNIKGGAPNWKITDYQKRIDVDAFEDNLFALLKKTNGKWRVVIYQIGCTDVCYLDWDKEYKAPKALFK